MTLRRCRRCSRQNKKAMPSAGAKNTQSAAACAPSHTALMSVLTEYYSQ